MSKPAKRKVISTIIWTVIVFSIFIGVPTFCKYYSDGIEGVIFFLNLDDNWGPKDYLAMSIIAFYSFICAKAISNSDQSNQK